jgi:hypothetical protein
VKQALGTRLASQPRQTLESKIRRLEINNYGKHQSFLIGAPLASDERLLSSILLPPTQTRHLEKVSSYIPVSF